MYKEEKIHINEKGNRRIQQKKHSAKRRTWNIAATVAFSALLFGGCGRRHKLCCGAVFDRTK